MENTHRTEEYRWWHRDDAARQRKEAPVERLREWIDRLLDSSHEGTYSEDIVTHISKLYEELLSRK